MTTINAFLSSIITLQNEERFQTPFGRRGSLSANLHTYSNSVHVTKESIKLCTHKKGLAKVAKNLLFN